MTKNIILKIIDTIFLFLVWIFVGVLLSPLWLLVAIFGASIQAFEWREVPKMWWRMVMIQFFFD